MIKETLISNSQLKMTLPFKVTPAIRPGSSVIAVHYYTTIRSTQSELTSEGQPLTSYTDNYSQESTSDSVVQKRSTVKEEFESTESPDGFNISSLSENNVNVNASTSSIYNGESSFTGNNKIASSSDIYNGESSSTANNKIELTTIVWRETLNLLTTLKSMENVLYTRDGYSQKEVSTNNPKLHTSSRKLTDPVAMIKG
jgi:hypothetical protein